MIYRDRVIEENNKKILFWLQKNRCDIEGYSDKDCPRCGRKLLRKNDKENPYSLFEKIRICKACRNDEEMRERYGINKIEKKDWCYPFSHGEV